MPRCNQFNTRNRLSARERLQFVDVDRIATKLARDFAMNVARVTTGADTLPVNHADLRDALRETISGKLRQAQEQV